jgi:hypothetical protein
MAAEPVWIAQGDTRWRLMWVREENAADNFAQAGLRVAHKY